MSVVPPIFDRSARPARAAGRAGAALAVLLIGSAPAVAIEPTSPEPVCPEPGACEDTALPLDRLSHALDHLKSRLGALRQDLEAARASDRPDLPESLAKPDVDALAVLRAERDAARAELEELRRAAAAERARWRRAEAAMTEELAGLRKRLGAAHAELERLQADRTRLESRIAELGEAVEQARTSEVVAALVRHDDEPVAAGMTATLAALPERARAPAVGRQGAAPQVPDPARRQFKSAGDRLQLEAELALAQLKIAELTAALQAARARTEALEGELASLRSLTDARIKQFLGRE